MTRDEKILLWKNTANQLAELKEREMMLRKELISECFQVNLEETEEGTRTLELGGGYKLKAGLKVSRSFDGGQEAVEKVLTKFEKFGAEGQILAERLVNWKPELSVSEYRKLPEKFRKLIDEIVVTKPASPSLEVVEPKAKK
jgi:hypothetical protein